MWLREHRPDAWAQTRWLLPVGGYLVAWLTGECVQDRANASSTLLYDLASGDYADSLCAAAELDREMLPRVDSATSVAGPLTPAAADALGLTTDCRVVVGTGDEHAASLAAGVIGPGVIADVTGTAEPVTSASKEALLDKTRLVETHAHAIDGVFLIENPGFVSGGSTLWLSELFKRPQADVFELAATAPAGSDGVTFLPTLTGAMTPHWNAEMRGSFSGLSINHGQEHLARAVIEGCAFAVRDIVDRLDAMGLAGDEVRIVGGGGRSALWNQIKADVLARPVRRVLSKEGCALGAAMLAGVAAGFFVDVPDAVARTIELDDEQILPNEAGVAVYAEAYDAYRRMFDAVESTAKRWPATSTEHAAELATMVDVGRLAAARKVALPLGDLLIAPNAIAELPRIAADLMTTAASDIVVLVDAVDYDGVSGPLKPQVLQILSGVTSRVRQVVVGSPVDRVHADDATLHMATESAGAAGLLVTVGSGTMADIGKVVSQRLGLPHVVVQTAGSVNGFADDQSVLLVDGAKRTTPSRWPDALVIDLDVISSAPIELNRAGVGDLASMFTAPADWMLASTIGFGVPYDSELVALVRPHGDRLLEVAGRLEQRRPDDLEFLARLLSISGLTMGLAGATAPSSGLEHVISHLLEMRASAAGAPPALHGEQVGIGVLVATAVWKRLRDTVGDTLPELVVPTSAERAQRVQNAFAVLGRSTAAECWSAYATKLDMLAKAPEALESLRAAWPAMQRTLDGLLAPLPRLVDALRGAGAALRFSGLASRFDADTVAWAVTHGHHMRDRFVVSDLVELLGLWDDAFVADVLDDLDALGAGR
jgi:xylulokinase